MNKSQLQKIIREEVKTALGEQADPEQIRKEVILRLSDFFRVSPYTLSNFKFDGTDNMQELTRALNSTSDKGTELYYQTAIKAVKRDLGVSELRVNEEVNPELDNLVKSFIKGIAQRNAYDVTDALYATFQSMTRLGFITKVPAEVIKQGQMAEAAKRTKK